MLPSGSISTDRTDELARIICCAPHLTLLALQQRQPLSSTRFQLLKVGGYIYSVGTASGQLEFSTKILSVSVGRNAACRHVHLMP